MGSAFKKNATKRLPAGAKVIVRKGQRLAEWLDAKEKLRTAPVIVGKHGADRIVITARTYTAKYRDGSGLVREVATGCRDESAARFLLKGLERRAEKVKGGILTADESGICLIAPLWNHGWEQALTRARRRVAASCLDLPILAASPFRRPFRRRVSTHYSVFALI